MKASHEVESGQGEEFDYEDDELEAAVEKLWLQGIDLPEARKLVRSERQRRHRAPQRHPS